MSTLVQLKSEIKTIQADLVVLEGMIETLKDSAYRSTPSVLIGNSLEVMQEFLSARTDRMDMLVYAGEADDE